MKMKTNKILLPTLSLLCPIVGSTATAQQTENNKPNIIQITVDDLGYADLSFLDYASKDVSTPGIDRLRQSGIFCSEAYATAPISSPARTGMITGRYQQRWGNYWFGEGGLPSTETTLPQLLRANGYFTAKVGKTHHNGGDAEHPLKHGFDYFMGFVNDTHDYLRLSQKDVKEYGEKHAKEASLGPLERNGKPVDFENRYITDVFTDEAIDILNEYTDKPLYLQLDYNAVHHPIYVNHPEYLKRFGIEPFPFWDPAKCTFSQWHNSWAKLEKIDPDGRTRYLTTLACLDDNISRLLDTLEKKNMMKNTIIIFISDNGGTINTYASNGPLRSFKKTLFDGGIRVPMIVSYPGHIKKNTIFRSAVSALDIMPTLLDYANIDSPTNLDGTSLVSRLEGQKQGASHEVLFWDDGINHAVHKGPWKLLVLNKLRPGFTKNDHYFEYYKLVNGKAVRDKAYYNPLGIQLYNIEKDRSENQNLAEQFPEIVKELEGLYKGWKSEMGKPVKMTKKTK